MAIDQLQNVIDEYVDRLPETSRRNAYGFPCYFVRDRVFGLYDGFALVLRFGDETVNHLLDIDLGKRFRHAGNSAMERSWVRINPRKVHSDEVLETLIRQSYDFVLGGC